MHRFVSSWIVVLILVAVSEGRALAAEPESCDGSTYDMVECLKAKTATWDARLNKAYQQALKQASSREQASKLRVAQRLWLQFREANCQYYDAGEGTIARIDAGECMRSMTEARAEELEGAGKR
jgi:uncharacterized protein YecT (DUF1311 family)